MAEKNRFSLFGFRLGKKEEEDQVVQPSFAPPSLDDGSVTVSSSAFLGTTIDQDGTAKNEVELISRYREMSVQPEIESAIEDIVNEAIVQSDTGKNVRLIMDELEQPEKIKEAIQTEFDNILKLLNFNNMGSDIFRRYYIDGRLFYHVIIDVNNPQKGILELRYIDPRKIKKIRELKKTKDPVTGIDIISDVSEYYVYNDRISATSSGTSITGVKIATDSIINVNSGLMDTRRSMVLSYLHKAIKPLNQLRMIEDASIIYKISRAPQRRIFYIDVGNLPKIKAEQYLRDMMVKYKNKITYDATTGEVRDDRRHLCLAMDTKVPLLDGRTLTLSEIAEEYKEKELWAYSCDPETGKFAPGLITWAGVSVKNAQMMRITLDNGKTIDCTPEHKFPVWENGLTMAKDLKEGDSLIPHYRRNENITPGAKKNKDYEQIWENDQKKWSFTHRAVSSWKDEFGLDNEFLYNEDFQNKEMTTVHHKNINRFDNSPSNLVRMNHIDHILFHRSSGSGSGKIGGKRCYEMGQGFHNKANPNYTQWHINGGKLGGKISSETGKSQENFAKGREVFANLIKDQEYYNCWIESLKEGWTEEKREVASEHAKKNNLSLRGNLAQKENWEDGTNHKKHKELYKVEYDISAFNVIKECAKNKLSTNQAAIELNNKENIIQIWKDLNKNKCLNPNQKSFEEFTWRDIGKIVKIFNNSTYQELKLQCQFRNHKIAKIEYLDERMDAGCLTIDGEEKYHNYHTFALESGVYTQNSMLEDFWLPRRSDGSGRGTEITTLESSDSFNDMSMVEYFERKLYKSLNVPVTRLNPEQAFNIGRTAEITRDELKFSKFIDKLRNKFAEIFDNALRIQLVLKGICTDQEWIEFKETTFFDFIKDNNFTELKEAELMQQRLGLLAVIDPYVGKYYSKEWIRKNVLRLDDEEIKEMEKQIEEEKKEDFAEQKEQIVMQQELVSLQQPEEGGDQEQQTPQEQSQQANPEAPINPINPYK